VHRGITDFIISVTVIATTAKPVIPTSVPAVIPTSVPAVIPTSVARRNLVEELKFFHSRQNSSLLRASE
jgi:hypothetical protein